MVKKAFTKKKYEYPLIKIPKKYVKILSQPTLEKFKQELEKEVVKRHKKILHTL